jgi:hypothetical protein
VLLPFFFSVVFGSSDLYMSFSFHMSGLAKYQNYSRSSLLALQVMQRACSSGSVFERLLCHFASTGSVTRDFNHQI